MSKALLKYSEWQGGSGNWYCNDISNLSSIRSKWWLPARMLGYTPADYVKWLVETYQPDQVSFDGETLIYSWNKEHYNKMHSFVLFINKIARNKGFII